MSRNQHATAPDLPGLGKSRVVVLDGFALNPGDLSWKVLDEFGVVVVHDRTPAEEIVSRASGASLLLTNKTPLTAETLAALPDLRYIGVLATGYNVIDVAAAKARGITVCNIPGYGTRAVAQHAFALILELAHHTGLHARGVAAGKWQASPDWCYWEKPLVELAGLTLGIVGYGSIGRAVAEIGRAFGMEILAASRSPKNPENGVSFVTLPQLLIQSDVVSLHCPLTDETKAMINTKSLALMKSSAFLINTSRGPLIDEQALAYALEDKVIAGAALDVLSVEPPPAGHPLIGAPNCLITPHQAWASKAARERLLGMAVENIRAFLSGHPIRTV